MAQKAVRHISVTAGSQSFDGRLASSTVYPGATGEVDEIIAFGDPEPTQVPRPYRKPTQFRFTVIDDGTLDGLYAIVNTVVSVSVRTTYHDGKTAGSATGGGKRSRDMVLLSAVPGEVTVDGDRKSTVVLTCVPHAPTA